MSAEGPYRVCVFDSGLGGLSVARELRQQAPDISITYCADNAGFPYGDLTPDEITQRTSRVLTSLISQEKTDAIVIACNTASTVVLDALRDRFTCPIVGVVPAVKPAAEMTKTGTISILATPGTIKRDYTQKLIEQFAADCHVTAVACARLAHLCEVHLSGYPVAHEDIMNEIAPAFIDQADQRTDTVVLGCTHYPLVLEMLERASPWPVWFVNPSAAVVRRLLDVLEYQGPVKEAINSSNRACLTGSKGVDPAFSALFLREGFQNLTILSI
jgi:glutamate racemase